MVEEKSQVSAAAPCSPAVAPPRPLLLQDSSQWLSNGEGDLEGIACGFWSLLFTLVLPQLSQPHSSADQCAVTLSLVWEG